MLATVVGRNPPYTIMKNFCYRDCHKKKKTVIFLKETLPLLPANIKLNLINWFNDSHLG